MVDEHKCTDQNYNGCSVDIGCFAEALSCLNSTGWAIGVVDIKATTESIYTESRGLVVNKSNLHY